jgi:hypothetical protein
MLCLEGIRSTGRWLDDGGFPLACRSSFDYCWAKTASFFVCFVCENCFKLEYKLGSDDLVNCVHKRSTFCLVILLRREGPEDLQVGKI